MLNRGGPRARLADDGLEKGPRAAIGTVALAKAIHGAEVEHPTAAAGQHEPTRGRPADHRAPLGTRRGAVSNRAMMRGVQSGAELGAQAVHPEQGCVLGHAEGQGHVGPGVRGVGAGFLGVGPVAVLGVPLGRAAGAVGRLGEQPANVVVAARRRHAPRIRRAAPTTS